MVAFDLNGKRVSVNAEPETPLLWAIREHLQLTGTKYGCGAGLCGACTVHVDGKALKSCQTALSDADGKSVTTTRGCRRMQAIRCRRRGSPNRCRNAVTASRVRS